VAIKDKTRKPFIEDNNTNIFIGVDLPFRKSDGVEGWFASTSTTIEAVKNNIRNLLQTEQGERLMQPTLGLSLRKYLFEIMDDEVIFSIQNDIVEVFKRWLPFVNIQDIQINMSNDNTSFSKNKLDIKIVFNITQDPNTLDSVQIEIGE